MEAIKENIRTFILKEFLDGENEDKLNHTTPLVTGGILDSISTAQLVAHLEEQFGVQFHAHEMSVDYLDTIDLIAETVQFKQE